MAHLRHVADHLDPLSRAAFRTLSPSLMESIAPSPTAMGVACPEFHQYLLRHKDIITNLTVLINDSKYEGIVHVIPSLQNLEMLDIRVTYGDIDLWPLTYVSNTIRKIHIVAHRIRFPTRESWPTLETLRLFASSVVTVDFREGQFPTMTTLHIQGHVFTSVVNEMPENIESLQMSVATFPMEFLRGICFLKYIRHLSFDGSRLTYLPEQFGELKTLESLSLRGNFLTIYNSYGERDGCMLPLSHLENLKYLDISDNACLDLGSPSIELPDSLRVLDVRSCVEGYYNEPFFENSNLHSLEILYTSHLPTRQEIQSCMQNLQTIVYAHPEPVKKPFHILESLSLNTPLCRIGSRIDGVRVPCTLDGVTIYMNDPMDVRDVVIYADL